MPSLSCILVASLCLLLGCSSSANPPPRSAGAEPASIRLRLASSLWPPFVDADDNPRYAVELVSTALARAGYVPQNEVTSLDVVLEGLKAGRIDGSTALWRSEEREQYLLYSQAYLENRLMLVARGGTPVSATSLGELAGKKVGIVKDYAYGPELEQAKEPVFVRDASSDEENLRALLRGELDYALVDALVVHHLSQHYPQQVREKLATGSTPLIKRTLHLALRKDLPDAERIMARFNAQLMKMLADGTYHQALHVSWIDADVDGDGRAELIAAGDKIGTEAPSAGYRPVSFVRGGAATDQEPARGRFMVKGVAYDSWQAVPDDYKTPSGELGSKPGTLRASVFEF